LAIGTQCILAGIDPAVGEKLAVFMLAYWALYIIASIEETEGFQSYTAHELEIFPWNEADQEGDERLHWFAK